MKIISPLYRLRRAINIASHGEKNIRELFTVNRSFNFANPKWLL